VLGDSTTDSINSDNSTKPPSSEFKIVFNAAIYAQAFQAVIFLQVLKQNFMSNFIPATFTACLA